MLCVWKNENQYAGFRDLLWSPPSKQNARRGAGRLKLQKLSSELLAKSPFNRSDEFL
jgi:hypothetical protein